MALTLLAHARTANGGIHGLRFLRHTDCVRVIHLDHHLFLTVIHMDNGVHLVFSLVVFRQQLRGYRQVVGRDGGGEASGAGRLLLLQSLWVRSAGPPPGGARWARLAEASLP